MTKQKKEIGVMRFTAAGLRDLATTLDNIYVKNNQLISMPIFQGDDGLYMALSIEAGFIQLVKDKATLKLIKVEKR